MTGLESTSHSSLNPSYQFIFNFSGAWSTIQYDDPEKDMYCPAHAFNFAFYYLVLYWVFLPLACCCGMMACCCKAFAKMSPPKGEGE